IHTTNPTSRSRHSSRRAAALTPDSPAPAVLRLDGLRGESPRVEVEQEAVGDRDLHLKAPAGRNTCPLVPASWPDKGAPRTLCRQEQRLLAHAGIKTTNGESQYEPTETVPAFAVRPFCDVSPTAESPRRRSRAARSCWVRGPGSPLPRESRHCRSRLSDC